MTHAEPQPTPEELGYETTRALAKPFAGSLQKGPTSNECASAKQMVAFMCGREAGAAGLSNQDVGLFHQGMLRAMKEISLGDLAPYDA